ncbi:Sir2 family NAD-dependent protein deacetylase [Verrucomicrobia bacterium]|nr:Sir2 family NAD-dependent protein deacetylase [Verrucomicrobiota bacterium]
MKTEIEELANYIRMANNILVFTGAGVSTGSGISDFRGPNGVWKRRQPVYYDDFMSKEEARLEHWDQKLEAWPSFLNAKPTESHIAAVMLEKAGKLEVLVTQNIDGLHSAAGTSSSKLVEIHGTNTQIECQQCRKRCDPAPIFQKYANCRKVPLCSCGGLLKPATISFGQGLHSEDIAKAEAGAESADLVVALGSTLGVYPAAGIPLMAAQRGIPYVVINLGATDQDNVDNLTLRIEEDVQAVFPAAVAMAL